MKFQESNPHRPGARPALDELPPSRPWQPGISLSGRNPSGLGTGSQGGQLEDDPFAIPLDGERQKTAPVTVPAIRSGSSAGSQLANVPQTSPVPLHESLLQCPFCLSVFRSGVAGRLGLCPVCAAVSQSPGVPEAESSSSTGKEPLPRLNRSGTMPVRKLHRSSNRVTRVGKWDGSGHSTDSSRLRRLGRLALLVGAVLLVCGVVAAMAGLAYSQEPTKTLYPVASVCDLL